MMYSQLCCEREWKHDCAHSPPPPLSVGGGGHTFTSVFGANMERREGAERCSCEAERLSRSCVQDEELLLLLLLV